MIMSNLSRLFALVSFLLTLIPSQIYAFHVPQSTSIFPTQSYVASKSFNAFAKRPMLTFSASSQEDHESSLPMRDRLRQVTGFSLTAFRAAWRAATGISLTAIYASSLAASGLWIRKMSAALLSIFPSWFRYFLQPFLVMYYAPLFILRCLTGPTRKEARMKHELVVEGWKQAIDYAEKIEQDGYWPVQLNADGEFELVSPPKPNEDVTEQLAKAVEESMDRATELRQKEGGENN